MSRLAAVLAVLLAFLASTPGSSIAQDPCPLTTPVFTGSLESKDITARVGEPAFLTTRLDPPEIPSGFYVSSLVDVVEAPAGAKPSVLTGYPRIRATFPAPGLYRLRVRLSLVAKSSCGGVKAATVMEDEAVVRVAP